MPILDLHAIRLNPWHAIDHDVPTNASRFLLEMAFAAALYCRRSEYDFMLAIRNGLYLPAGWQPSDGHPDAHEEIEHRWWLADVRLRALAEMLTARGVAMNGSG